MTGNEIYPLSERLWHKTFYVCWICDAYVGCHPGSDKPLGSLANAELRAARVKTHTLHFDPLWKNQRLFGYGDARRKAYEWLAGKLGIRVEDCHIGQFDLETCNKVMAFCMERSMGRG